MNGHPDDPLSSYREMTINGPLGSGLRFQWLAINRDIMRQVRTPAWDEFSQYLLFSKSPRDEPTMEAMYPQGDFVLEILRKPSGYYENVIGVTMYNEGQEEMLYSLRGIWKNIKAASGGRKRFGRSLVVAIVDGCGELHKNAALLQTLEVKYKLYSKSAVERALTVYGKLKSLWESRYKRELEKKKQEHYSNRGREPEVIYYDIKTDHRDVVFAFESRLALGAADLYATTEDTNDTPAFDILFLVKAENRKKLHSHLWLFYGICLKFMPKYVFLIDMGTEPKRKSLIALHDHFENNPKTGGCCGEIIVKDAPWYNPLVGAQWFEYKIGHIIYKMFESCMGFIPVLPGAFSAYRWQALVECEFQVMKEYLLPFLNPRRLDWTLTNIYFLAEDRIMSEEIVKVRVRGRERHSYSYSLRFVKESKALTEGVDELVNLIKQRRRWINGSWFALIKVLKGCQLLQSICFQSSHSFGSKLKFAFLSLYMLVIMLMTWFSIGVYYIGYSMVVKVRLHLANLL